MFKRIIAVLYQIIESKIVVLLIGIFLTNIIVKNLEHKHQKSLQRNERMFQLFDYKIQFVERLTQLSCDKLYALRKVSWALGKNDDKKALELWEIYLEKSDEWNRNLVNNKITIETFASDTLSNLFLAHDYERIEKPNSLHAHFDEAHRVLLAWVNYKQNRLGNEKIPAENFRRQAAKVLDELDAFNNYFIKCMHRSLLNQTISISKKTSS